MRTQAIEDYLKGIFRLQEQGGKVSTKSLAERLGVASASVTGMLKKLADLKLVVHEPYQGVRLTGAGRKIAVEVVRHHRLVERYLAEALGVPWDRVHDEAEKWEHVLSEELEERIDAALGYPATDPHGSPIPRRDGTIVQPECISLDRLETGRTAILAEVSDHDPALLRYLGELGLYPGVTLTLRETAPFDGPLTIEVGNDEHVLGREVARHIRVTDGKPPS
jgi:DtxR family Mn-dependent transcriptional regulator